MIRTIKIVVFAAFIALATSVFATDDVVKDNIRDIQQILKDCGFNPGPADGIWGKRTGAAAKKFIRAHGATPTGDEIKFLMAQVDGYRVGDSGPCPPPETATTAETKTKAETDLAGRPSDEKPEVTASQGHEIESGGEGAEELEWLRKNLDFEILKRNTYTTATGEDKSIYTGGATVDFSGSTVTMKQWYVDEYCCCGGCQADRWNSTHETDLSELESISFWTANSKINLTFNCRDGKECWHSFYSLTSPMFLHDGTLGELEKKSDEMTGKVSIRIFDSLDAENFDKGFKLFNEIRSAATEEQLEDGGFSEIDYQGELTDVFNRLIAIYDAGGTVGERSSCYEWAFIGEFALGGWINSNGVRTSSRIIGSNAKQYNGTDLLKVSRNAHDNCLVYSEQGEAEAVGNMITAGRTAADISSEKQRISSFYRKTIEQCQAEFARRYEILANKMCK